VDSSSDSDNCPIGKRLKRESRNQPDDMFSFETIEEQMKLFVKRAIKVYHQIEIVNDIDRFDHLVVLNRLRKPFAWSLKKLVTTPNQMKCVMLRDINSEKFLSSFQKWITQKLAAENGRLKKDNYESISNKYALELQKHGINLDDLESRVPKTRRKSTRESPNSSSTTTVSSTSNLRINPVGRALNSISIDSFDDGCRLCGNKRARLIQNMYSKFNGFTFKSVVEAACG
jgi:hypothetical protein